MQDATYNYYEVILVDQAYVVSQQFVDQLNLQPSV